MTLRELLLEVTNNHSLDMYLKQYDELDHELYINLEHVDECNKITSMHLDEDGDVILEFD
jgi:hypothetical protein